MADLLECLIQIKGVSGTPARLARRVEDAMADSSSRQATGQRVGQVVGRLLAAEGRYLDALGKMLAAERPAVPRLLDAGEPAERPASIAEGVREFAARRAETVRELESCSAEQLNCVGIEPSRGPMTVADLVAVMLAHDTDSLGELTAVSGGGRVVRRRGDFVSRSG